MITYARLTNVTHREDLVGQQRETKHKKEKILQKI